MPAPTGLRLSSRNYPVALFYIAYAIDGHCDGFRHAARPFDLQAVDRGRASQTEVNSARALAGVSVSSIDLSNLRQSAGLNPYPRANGIAIRPGADQLKFNPVAG